MIRLYTSYYANMKNIPANYLMVGISQFCPDWLKDDAPDNFLFVRGNFLAPTKELLNDIIFIIKERFIENSSEAYITYKYLLNFLNSLGVVSIILT